MDAPQLFSASLGVLTTAQLRRAGVTKRQIRDAVAAGTFTRVRRGWLAYRGDPAAVAAVRACGAVSCLSAMEHLGAWQPRRTLGHVRRADAQRDRRGQPKESHRPPSGAAAQGARRPARDRAAKGCRPYGSNPPVLAAIDDLETAFRCALRCADREQLITVADSIVHRKLATLDELRHWSEDAPLRVRALLELVEPKSEAGTESMVRLRLRRLGIVVRVQQWIGRRRVDLLIGDRLIIECDSAAWHTDAEAFQRDRRTDRIHVALGYLVVRLTWEQIHDEWPQIEQDILAIVRRGDHRWPPRLRPAARAADGAEPGVAAG
ncbi:type IV toxin-antitoxin system AbiEi family antitoxin domain-containing protein [Agrococcus sp. ProA11]|uniref:type IV toxin-antitoxin system AbiEi family antitoxin domain-containing protein n=1 Tax=Agrococcus chionoecetis TaxID=3153752 RepID=UPI003260E4B7